MPPDFSPCYFFFYGSLMDSDVLQTVLRLSQPLECKGAKISGYAIKMWSIYPALVPCDGGEVRGMACQISEPEHFRRLCNYETGAYKPCISTIALDDGTVLEESRTFVWAGDPESVELSEGSFDLERYQKYFKQSVVRQRK